MEGNAIQNLPPFKLRYRSHIQKFSCSHNCTISLLERGEIHEMGKISLQLMDNPKIVNRSWIWSDSVTASKQCKVLSYFDSMLSPYLPAKRRTTATYSKQKCEIEVVAASRGSCTCELKVTEDHLNRGGALHGGFTAMLVDSVSTVAIMTADKPPGVSVDLSVTYLSPARAGDTLLVTAECLKLGKTIAFATVDVRNKKDGQLVAQGRQTKHLGLQRQPSN